LTTTTISGIIGPSIDRTGQECTTNVQCRLYNLEKLRKA